VKLGNREKLGSVSASLATLCLPADATAGDARRAYRDLVRLLHPDRYGVDGASEELAAVLAAYQYLERSGWLAEHADEIVRSSGQLVDTRA
jgi:hypothetical protein